MKIAVIVKSVTGGAVDAADGFLRAGRTLPAVLPAFDAHAVEEALRIRERDGKGGEIILLSIGAREGLGGLRQALAMGADRAVLFSDPLLVGADIAVVSHVLAALLAREAPDLTLACPWAGDLDGSMLLAMTAARLGRPSLGQLRTLTIENGVLSGDRQTETGDQRVSGQLPCLVEIGDSINKPRNATIADRRRANAKPVQLIGIADLFGEDRPIDAKTSVLAVSPAPATRNPTVLQQVDVPDGVITFLRDRRLIT